MADRANSDQAGDTVKVPETPAFGRNMWPRPLGLHLMSGLMSQSAEVAADPAMMKILNDVASAHALAQQMQQGVGDMLRGIELYQQHAWHRPPLDAPIVWQDGAAKLGDYGGNGPTALVVPSLVNRSYVLDLMTDCSLMRWLAETGTLRPLLLDWGTPGDQEQTFGLAAYITGPLKQALDFAVQQAGGPVTLIGYCMGGDLALAAARLWPEKVSRLVLLATPWDFHGDISASGKMFADNIAMWQPVLDAMGELPVDLLQCFFAALDPSLALKKFGHFAQMDMDTRSARHFVALEDWVNDGVPLTPRVALETLGGWFRDNTTANERWLVGGQIIRPDDITVPACIAIPTQDRIVPPASSQALADKLPGVHVIEPDAGHIGMIVSRKAKGALWTPLKDWLDGT